MSHSSANQPPTSSGSRLAETGLRMAEAAIATVAFSVFAAISPSLFSAAPKAASANSSEHQSRVAIAAIAVHLPAANSNP